MRNLILMALAAVVGVSVSAASIAQSTPPAQTAKPVPVTDPAKVDALSAAARKGDLATVRKLLDEGVDVNTKFRYNATALSYAADRGFADIVKLLIERGADVNIRDTFYNATPLTWAAGPAQARTPTHAECVRLLLIAGATGAPQALNAALSASDAPMVKAVLEHGKLSATNLTNALETAMAGKKTEIVALLEAAGAKPAPVVTLTAEQLARYEGTYESPKGDVVVKIVDGRLVIDGSRLGAPPDLALKARSETEFAAVNPQMGGLVATFTMENNKVTALALGGLKFTRKGGQS
jgi:hypothetical protein